MSFIESAIPEALEMFLTWDGIEESLIISTCNRIEIYAVTQGAGGENTIIDFLCSYHKLERQRIAGAGYSYSNLEAIKHLFRVVSGLDSMVIGETQIVGQVKTAYETTLKAESSGKVLNKLFTKALQIQKKVRTTTDIDVGAVSISYAAVELAKEIFGELADKTALVIGAGEMSELTAQHLIAQGVSEIIVVNRTYERAKELAQRFHGKALPFDEKLNFLLEADIVISSTSSPYYIIEKNKLSEIMQKRQGKALFLIDIAVPRDIAPDVSQLENVYLYNIDSLQAVAEANQKRRQKEAEKAEKIIDDEAAKFYAHLRVLNVNPTVKSLRQKFDEIRIAELQKCFKKTPNLSSQQQEAVEYLTRAIINKLLHPPTVYLKQSAVNSEEYPQDINTLQKLFALEEVRKNG